MRFIKAITLERSIPWILVIVGVIGLLCSFTLTVDKMESLRNPSFHPICDLNPIISCGSVMKSAQSQAFGFDNTFIGLAGFAVLITTGVVLLAGAQLKRWFWLGLQLGATFGLLFVHWLIFNSLYRIHSLCPFCMVVWTITITLFWYVTLHNIEQGHVPVHSKAARTVAFIRKHHFDILVIWLLIIATLILKQFWYYYGPRLGF